nr:MULTISPECIES: hybrid sensor histidine kinase/response regulator [Myxococcaceae]
MPVRPGDAPELRLGRGRVKETAPPPSFGTGRQAASEAPGQAGGVCGSGARFCPQPRGAERKTAKVTEGPSAVASILIVDDHPGNLLALEGALAPLGQRLVRASTGEEALRAALREEFACVLLDVHMGGGIDGFETARLLKGREKSRHTPILFLTGTVQDQSFLHRAYEHGAVDYLLKPFDPDVLLAKVRVFTDLYLLRERVKGIERAEAAREEAERQRALLEARAAQMQQLAQEREHALRLRDEFLTVAAHELKTPLTPLHLRLASLARVTEAEPTGALSHGRLAQELDVMRRQVRKLADLINDLLDASRIAAGRLQPGAREPVDLGQLAQEVAARLQPAARESGSALDVRVEAPSPVALVDRPRIEQVLSNLLTNALTYGGGEPVLVSVRAEGERAVLQVQDRGIGIATAQLARIFERYERAVSESHYGGLGLGLYIARQIVEDHGGRIRAESRPGEGSTFTVDLPLSPPPPPGA